MSINTMTEIRYRVFIYKETNIILESPFLEWRYIRQFADIITDKFNIAYDADIWNIDALEEEWWDYYQSPFTYDGGYSIGIYSEYC